MIQFCPFQANFEQHNWNEQINRHVGGPNGFELLIAGFGTVLFVGAAFLDFYTMPRTYRDDQYLAGALGMYLTYINLFIFILRLMIALQGGGRRD